MGLLDMTPERAGQVMARMIETLDPVAGGTKAARGAASDGLALIIYVVLTVAEVEGTCGATTAISIAGILRAADRIDRELTEQATAAGRN